MFFLKTTSESYILSLDTLLDHVFACCSKESRPTTFIHRVLHEWFNSIDANFPYCSIGINSLLLLIRLYATRVSSVDPWPHSLGGLKARFVVFHMLYKSTDRKNLSELGAVVEVHWTNVSVDLLHCGEFG